MVMPVFRKYMIPGSILSEGISPPPVDVNEFPYSWEWSDIKGGPSPPGDGPEPGGGDAIGSWPHWIQNGSLSSINVANQLNPLMYWIHNGSLLSINVANNNESTESTDVLDQQESTDVSEWIIIGCLLRRDARMVIGLPAKQFCLIHLRARFPLLP